MKYINEHIGDYLNGLRSCLDELGRQDIEGIVDIIFDAYKKGKRVFIIGNGGSAATASHFACDLSKSTACAGRPRLKASSLTDNVAIISALANDIEYSSIFQEQLVDQLSEGDIVIGISASGNSPNILKAIEFARSQGAVTIGLTGFGGGKLMGLADKSTVLASRDYGQVEDTHLVLGHIITSLIRERIANG